MLLTKKRAKVSWRLPLFPHCTIKYRVRRYSAMGFFYTEVVMKKKPNRDKQQDVTVVHLDTHGDRLKYARNLRGYTQDYVADKAGIAQSILSSYEKNSKGVHRVRLAIMVKLAMVLDVSMDWLMTGKERNFSLSGKILAQANNYAPILAWQDIRKWKFTGKENMNLTVLDNVPLHGIENNNCFALVIEKKIDDFSVGDTVVINPHKKPAIGNYILVSDHRDGEIYIRSMVENDIGALFFDADDDIKELDNQAVCYGVLVANIKKLA